jgi:hypothetical protein
MTIGMTTPSIKWARLFDTEEAAQRALDNYTEVARTIYGPRVWLGRSIDAPVYCLSQGGWLAPVQLHKPDRVNRTVWLTESNL